MMTTEEKQNKMISQGLIILDLWDMLAHYALIFTMGTANLLILVIAWDQKPPNPTGATMTNEDLLIFTAVDIFLLTAFYFIQRERLKLKKETLDLELSQILEVINGVGKTFDWFVKTLTKDFIQADSIRILGTDNRITIFIRDNDVYINCRTKGGDIPGVFRQDKITETFLSALRMKSYEVKHQKEKLEKQASR